MLSGRGRSIFFSPPSQGRGRPNAVGPHPLSVLWCCVRSSSVLGRRVREVAMRRMMGPTWVDEEDFLAAEEPLEIRRRAM